MRLFGFEITAPWSQRTDGQSLSIDQVIKRFEESFAISSGIALNPDLAMSSPTVQAIVQAVSRRISTLPIHVVKKTTTNGRTRKEPQPDHPVTALLAKPNRLSNPSKFWLDATSWLVRYGNFYSWKGQTATGKVLRLIPLHPGSVAIDEDQADIENVTYRVTFRNGNHQQYTPSQILHARGPARDGIRGDSIVMDTREAIGLEIAAERFGAMFFGNGATPGLVITQPPGSQGPKTAEDAKKLRDELENVYGKKGRHRVFVLPKGLEVGQQIEINNDKAQFLGLRQYQRTVIAGAFGVPNHMVGDLSKGTFNNVEQQSLAFIANVVQPYCEIFEAAMEQSLLTDEERAAGYCIRFDLDAALRADFKTRQEGLAIQRQNGVLSPNDWRAIEGMNPREGGDTYLDGGTSGQQPAGDKPEPKPTEDEPDEDEGEDNDD